MAFPGTAFGECADDDRPYICGLSIVIAYGVVEIYRQILVAKKADIIAPIFIEDVDMVAWSLDSKPTKRL